MDVILSILISIINFFKANISWIKDIGMLIFAGVGTIVTVLAYRRARATILQPIRNEVIKKQSVLLSEVLNVCQSSLKNDLIFDYINLIRVNILKYLMEYGFVLNSHEDTCKKLDKCVDGFFYCGDSDIIDDVEIVPSFPTEISNSKNLVDEKKTKYEEANEGKIRIDKIYHTKEYSEYIDKIHSLSINPFMPKTIQKILEQLLLDIKRNLKDSMKPVLEEFFRIFINKYSEEKIPPKYSPNGVFNDFNHRRIHHTALLESLNKETRKYLRIDEPWE